MSSCESQVSTRIVSPEGRKEQQGESGPAIVSICARPLLCEAMEDMADAREPRGTLARIKAGLEKTVDSVEVYRRNGH